MQDKTRIVLFDTQVAHDNLLPLSFTRPMADFRIGILTIAEKWRRYAGEADVSRLPVNYLRNKFWGNDPLPRRALWVAANVLPDANLVDSVTTLEEGEALFCGEDLVAYNGEMTDMDAGNWRKVIHIEGVRIVRFVFDVFLLNPDAIREDFRLLTADRVSCPLPAGNQVIGDMLDADGHELLFIEEGASVEGAIINLREGPVYIGRNSVVMEGSCVRGPLALCDNAKIRMGAKIYGGSTFGPYCKVGGEVDNTVIFGYSNKAHDGYLGNAVIGEWCNIGAGTNASNLKNDYSKIRIWNYASRTFMRTDLQFCGLIMGDHSKAGINCMFNTASVVGVGVNIHGSGFPRVFIPSFSEGSPTAGFTDVTLKKFHTIAERVMQRRGISLDDSDREVFARIYEVASSLKG